jgi:predicted amidohydrolase
VPDYLALVCCRGGGCLRKTWLFKTPFTYRSEAIDKKAVASVFGGHKFKVTATLCGDSMVPLKQQSMQIIN